MKNEPVKVVTWYTNWPTTEIVTDFWKSYPLTDGIYLTIYDHKYAAVETLTKSDKYPGCFEGDRVLFALRGSAYSLNIINELENMSAAELLIHIAKHKGNEE